MTVTVEPFENGFGAKITDVDLSRPLDGEVQGAIYGAFLEHRIIVIPGQSLSPDQVVAASRIFGDELEPHLFEHFHHPDTPLIMVLSNRVKDGKAEGLADAGSFWHSDVSYKPNPAKATLLYAVEIPDEGGDTLFSDMTAAYETLGEAMKDRLDGLWAVHNYAHTPREIFTSGQVQAPPDCRHPVVRTHPVTERKAIYINPTYTVRIEGLADNESEALKQEIFDHCLQDRFRVRYRWRAGDIVAWDNAASMHSATTQNLDPDKHRILWRTIISGGPTF